MTEDDDRINEIEATISKVMKEAHPDLMMEGFIVVVPCIGAGGETTFTTWYDHDRPVSSTLGFLRLVEYDLLKSNDEQQL